MEEDNRNDEEARMKAEEDYQECNRAEEEAQISNESKTK